MQSENGHCVAGERKDRLVSDLKHNTNVWTIAKADEKIEELAEKLYMISHKKMDDRSEGTKDSGNASKEDLEMNDTIVVDSI